ncbi:MAG: DMT family transporter [Gammaproteobacteria bacterium]
MSPQSAQRENPPENQPFGVFLVFFGASVWSTAGIYTRLVSTDIPTTIFLRGAVGVLMSLFLLFCIFGREAGLRGVLRFSKGELVVGALAGSSILLFISAFFYTSIANVMLIYGGMPLVTFILAILFLKDRADKVSAAACGACIAGMALIAGGAQRFDDAVGIALSVVNCIVFALLTVAGKYFRDVNAMRVAFLATAFSALAALPFATFGEANSQDYIWLAMFGAINVPLGTGIYLLGVQRVSALTAALVGMVEIPIAALWAWMLFNEEIGLGAFAGGMIVLAAAAVYVINKSRFDNARPAAIGH